jgi:hypothetical protein
MLDAKSGSAGNNPSESLDDRHITKIHIRAKDAINGLGMDFTNETHTKWHGGPGAQQPAFELKEGEAIIRVFCNASTSRILGLRFETSLGERSAVTLVLFISNSCGLVGRISQWYGTESTTPLIWYRGGNALGGFRGSSKDVIHGLTVSFLYLIPKSLAFSKLYVCIHIAAMVFTASQGQHRDC